MTTTTQLPNTTGRAICQLAVRLALIGSVLLLGGCASKLGVSSVLAGDENCLDASVSVSDSKLSADCALLQRQAYEKALGLMTLQIFR